MKAIAIILLAACLTLLGFAAFAQQKTDTAKVKTSVAAPKPKPVYHSEPNKVYHIEFNIQSYQLKALTEQLDGKLESDETLKPAELQALKDECKFFKHIIIDEVKAREDFDYQKFMSDTSSTKQVMLPKKK